MAANTSFKVQCPSCEAMIPVRDPNLVGKKIDCPKCKYRFVVEDPNGADEGDADAPKGAKVARGAGKAKFKKKAGGNNMIVLGSVLGVVAVAILGVVGWLVFGGSGGSGKPASGPVASTTPTPAP